MTRYQRDACQNEIDVGTTIWMSLKGPNFKNVTIISLNCKFVTKVKKKNHELNEI